MKKTKMHRVEEFFLRDIKATNALLDSKDKDKEELSKMDVKKNPTIEKLFWHPTEKMRLSIIFFTFLTIMCFVMYHTLITSAAFRLTNKKFAKFENSLQNDEKLLYEYTRHAQATFNEIYKKMSEETEIKMNALYEEIANLKNVSEYNDKHIVNSLEKLRGATCSLIPDDKRFDCHPELGATEAACIKRNCCWKSVHKTETSKNLNNINVPYCYYNLHWKIYDYENVTTHGNCKDISGFLKLKSPSPYKNDLPLIKIESTSVDKSILRVKLYDPSKARYEPPLPSRSNPRSFSGETSYELKIDKSVPGFSVHRSSNKETVFNSNGVGGFIFANQFLQMSSLLPSKNIYGLGERRTNLKLNTNWEVLTLFNRDHPPQNNTNLYGSHPFYMVIEESGNCHGVLFLNSNAMDIILQPAPAITFRTIGGIFDIYFFMGPTPADVLKQYSEIIGKPFLPPYWSLGFHLSRFGYDSLEKTKETWRRTKAAKIPFDTQWNDLDYMDQHNDFTYDQIKFKNLPEFVKSLHSEGMHYIPLIDAGVSGTETDGGYFPFNEGIRRGIFIKENGTNLPFQGKVWNLNSTVWPDFTNPKTQDYYLRMMNDTYQNFKFDGAWIDMNEPSNFYDGLSNGCTKNDLDYPEYVPQVDGGLLSAKTLCMNARHYLGYHYDLHNIYGTSQAVATNYALKEIRNKRPFIISRSTWVGHGTYAGHWTGDIDSSWDDLRMSIPGILQSTFFHIPMNGADICGFNRNTTPSLCNRWMQVGAFYPFSRNHNANGTIEQDPVFMGELVVKSSKKALTIRYELLPYLYTLFFRAHQFGETVARPLFFEFTNDSNTYNIDSQFLWGSSLMIVPVLDEVSDKNEEVLAYIPAGIWYDFHTNDSILSTGQNMNLKAPSDTIPLLVRGGSILPMQRASLTTTASRKNQFGLLIALDDQQSAKGQLYLDDGDSLDPVEKMQMLLVNFTVNDNTLNSRPVWGFHMEKMTLGRIKVMGLTMDKVSRVFINDKEITNDKFYYNKNPSYLFVTNICLDFKSSFTLSWTDTPAETKSFFSAAAEIPLYIHSSASVSTSYNIFLLTIFSLLFCIRLLVRNSY